MLKTPEHNLFYVDPSYIKKDHLFLTGSEFKHAVMSLRLKPGDLIKVVDGTGNEFLAEMREIRNRDRCYCSIIKVTRKPREPLCDVILLQAVLKGDRFDYLVEKAVELGVNKIIPVESARCIVKSGGQKVERWNRIAVSAMKQSGRSVLPEITDVKTWIPAIEGLPPSLIRIILNADGKIKLRDHLSQNSDILFNKPIIIAVGPEGDFAPEEIEKAAEYNFKSVTLGPRRLRSETAGIAALSVIFSFE